MSRMGKNPPLILSRRIAIAREILAAIIEHDGTPNLDPQMYTANELKGITRMMMREQIRLALDYADMMLEMADVETSIKSGTPFEAKKP